MPMVWYPTTRDDARLNGRSPSFRIKVETIASNIDELGSRGPETWKRNEEEVRQQFRGYVLIEVGYLNELVLVA